MRSDSCSERFQGFAIDIVEGGGLVGVDIEHRDKLAACEEGNDDLGTGLAIACDVVGDGVNIVDHLSLEHSRRSSAHTARERNLDTADWPLVRPDAQQARGDDAVETGPAGSRNRCKQNRRRCRHYRHRIIEIGQELVELEARPTVGVSFLALAHRAECREVERVRSNLERSGADV